MTGLNSFVLLDTNIFLDIIAGFDENDAISSKDLIDSIQKGEHLGIIISPVLTEIYYLIARGTDEEEAKKYIKMILSIPNIQILPVGQEESIKAGYIYHKYNEGQKRNDWLSVVDCLILACSFYLESSVVCTWDHRFEQVKVDNVIICRPCDISNLKKSPKSSS